ncbi:midasin [Trichonephila clavipes]|nr:midasin [Trichonephila clavipes]
MRNGYWIILDELNLAPTEVMEALNRVLDDNRELFISETQKTVKAKQGFMVFATQNPPGHYGGRKILSRAFRNRFIELHFNDIPPPELEVILAQRCKIPPSYSKKLVAVMHDLQVQHLYANYIELGLTTQNPLLVYTDASKESNRIGSCAFIEKLSRCNPENCPVFRSELIAIDEVLKYILNRTDSSNIWILADIHSAIQHLQDWTRGDDLMSIRIINKLKTIAKS